MKNSTLWLIIILFLSTVIRIANVDGQQLWGDEIDSVYRAAAFWTFYPIYLFYQDGEYNDPNGKIFKPYFFEGYGNQQPFYYTMLAFWVRLFGTSVVALRLLSVIVSVIATGIIYLIGREFFSEKTGLLAAFIFAISPFHLYYAHELRSYAFITLFTLLSTLYYWRLQQGKKGIIGYGLCTGLMLLTHTHGFFILFLHVIHYLLFGKGNAFLKGCGLVFVVYLPWLIHFINQLRFIDVSDSAYWYIFSWIDLPAVYLVFGLGQTLIVKESPLFFSIPISILYLASFGFICFYALWYGRKKPMSFLFLWLTIPVVLPWAISLIKPMYTFRYVSVAAGALCIILAEGYNLLAKKQKTLFTILFAILTVLSIASVISYETLPARQQSREVTEYITTHYSNGEPIFVHHMNYQFLLRYYNSDLFFIGLGEHAKRLMDSQHIERFRDTISSAKSFWIVYSATDSKEEIHKTAVDMGFHVNHLKVMSGFHLYHYEKK